MTSSRPEKQVKPLHPYQAARLEALLEGDEDGHLAGAEGPPVFMSREQIAARSFQNREQPSEQPSSDPTT